MGETHVLKEGWGYWDVSKYPYGGDFRRGSAAVGIRVAEDEHAPAGEVVAYMAGRRIVVKREALIEL